MKKFVEMVAVVEMEEKEGKGDAAAGGNDRSL